MLQSQKFTLETVAVGSGETKYTQDINFRAATGEILLKIVSSAGSITITQEVSLDGSNFGPAQDSSGNPLGAVIATMTNGTKYVEFNPIYAPFIRFKIVEGGSGATNVTISGEFQQDK